MLDIINVLECFAPVFSARAWRHVEILVGVGQYSGRGSLFRLKDFLFEADKDMGAIIFTNRDGFTCLPMYVCGSGLILPERGKT